MNILRKTRESFEKLSKNKKREGSEEKNCNDGSKVKTGEKKINFKLMSYSIFLAIVIFYLVNYSEDPFKKQDEDEKYFTKTMVTKIIAIENKFNELSKKIEEKDILIWKSNELSEEQKLAFIIEYHDRKFLIMPTLNNLNNKKGKIFLRKISSGEVYSIVITKNFKNFSFAGLAIYKINNTEEERIAKAPLVLAEDKDFDKIINEEKNVFLAILCPKHEEMHEEKREERHEEIKIGLYSSQASKYSFAYLDFAPTTTNSPCFGAGSSSAGSPVFGLNGKIYGMYLNFENNKGIFIPLPAILNIIDAFINNADF